MQASVDDPRSSCSILPGHHWRPPYKQVSADGYEYIAGDADTCARQVGFGFPGVIRGVIIPLPFDMKEEVTLVIFSACRW